MFNFEQREYYKIDKEIVIIPCTIVVFFLISNYNFDHIMFFKNELELEDNEQ
jgi:hypothetical protein